MNIMFSIQSMFQSIIIRLGGHAMEPYIFEDSMSFRSWLVMNNRSHPGIWLVFGKASGPKTLTPDEALLEALCFGWIDGQIKKIDEFQYIKYFAERRAGSVWSERNKKFADLLEKQGKMTDRGREKIVIAKQKGQWDNALEPLTLEHVNTLLEAIGNNPLARMNFLNMSFSVQKTYAGYYLSAKQESTRIKRLNDIIERLNRNLKPME
jgi:uncharacterized protein YdeI (YjbR/CyaY-like superfamily)